MKIWLPYPPSLNHIHQTAGRMRIKTDKYRVWEADAYEALLQQRPWKRFTGLVEISVTLGRPDKRKRDLDNVGAKVILDLLVKHQIIRDDCDVVRITMAWGTESGAVVEVRGG